MTSFLQSRSNGQCEICKSNAQVEFAMLPARADRHECHVHLCSSCSEKLSQQGLNSNDWRAVGDVMWSEHMSVQVLCYRILRRLTGDSWADSLVDQIYLEDDVRQWADSGKGAAESQSDDSIKIVDSNGTRLATGDSVTLIKDLDVKGGGFTAKRGTLVKNIVLTDDPKYIEGKINGSQIVIVAAYTKKA
jgi:protein PhnA